jgi:predicted nucleic acid-binding protein
MNRVLVDTGPIVALLNSRDLHHDWATKALDSIEPPLLTCEAVISEACFLVRRLPAGPATVLALLERGVIEVPFHLGAELAAVKKLMARYESVPMSLADACLVRMAELDPRALVATCDHDFTIYRRRGRQPIQLVAPFVS